MLRGTWYLVLNLSVKDCVRVWRWFCAVQWKIYFFAQIPTTHSSVTVIFSEEDVCFYLKGAYITMDASFEGGPLPLVYYCEKAIVVPSPMGFCATPWTSWLQTPIKQSSNIGSYKRIDSEARSQIQNSWELLIWKDGV